MSRLVAPNLLIPTLHGQGGPNTPAAEFIDDRKAGQPPTPSRAAVPHLGRGPLRSDSKHVQSSTRSDSKASSIRLHVADPLPSRDWSTQGSEAHSQPASPTSALGGAISTFGAPAEWWHDSIILGRLSALAVRYFATKAVKRPWKAWVQYIDTVRHKQDACLRSQLQLALRFWRRSGPEQCRQMQQTEGFGAPVSKAYLVAWTAFGAKEKLARFIRARVEGVHQLS